MGLPMYSPSISKRQLPSKQPTSPPYTPQAEENFEESFPNSRTSSFDITELELGPPQRSQRSRRSSSLPYSLVQQQMYRLHQLHQLHRTREQQQMSSNLALRRGLNSAHQLSLNNNHRSQIHNIQQMQAATIHARRQDRNLTSESSLEPSRNIRNERLDDSHDEIIDFPFDDFVSSFDNNNNNLRTLIDGDGVQRNNNDNNSSSSSNSNNNFDNDNNNNNNNSHNNRSSNIALDNVVRRVNLLRQITQQQEVRSMRPSSRHHRSSGHSSSGRSSRITSQNINVGQRRDDLIQRGIDIPPSSSIRHSSHSSHSIPDSTLLYEYNTPLPPMSRLWHTRRGVNWSTTDPQRTERRSSFSDDFYSTPEISHQYEFDDHHLSRILSPIPRRYEARFSSALSLPIGSNHELLSSDNNRSNVDTEQRGSASGEVC